MRSDDVNALPKGLPAPEDDGACDHLTGLALPAVSLTSTSGKRVYLPSVQSRFVIIYCYPRTGRPDCSPLGGEAAWNAIPGARGCTPQSCAYRDHFNDLTAFEATVFGLSTQSTEDQQEAVYRLHLPYGLLSDAQLEFARALQLPTFAVEGHLMIKRLTLIVRHGRIEKVLYPVFPPDQDARRVLDWLKQTN